MAWDAVILCVLVVVPICVHTRAQCRAATRLLAQQFSLVERRLKEVERQLAAEPIATMLGPYREAPALTQASRAASTVFSAARHRGALSTIALFDQSVSADSAAGHAARVAREILSAAAHPFGPGEGSPETAERFDEALRTIRTCMEIDEGATVNKRIYALADRALKGER